MVKLPTPGRLRGIADLLQRERTLEMIVDTRPSDATGHTTMAVPRGHSQGLPVGAMLVCGKSDEATVPRAARAFDGAQTYPPGPNVPVGKSW